MLNAARDPSNEDGRTGCLTATEATDKERMNIQRQKKAHPQRYASFAGRTIHLLDGKVVGGSAAARSAWEPEVTGA